MIDIIIGFSRSRKVLAIGSWVIAESEKREYSHCYMRFKCPMSGQWMVFQASKGLVNEMNYGIFQEQNVVIKEYLLHVTEEDFAVFYKFMKMNLGKKYSTKQILWLTLKKLLQIKNWSKPIYSLIRDGNSSFICSEIVAMCCMLLNADLKRALRGKQLDQITPSDMDTILSDNNLINILR